MLIMVFYGKNIAISMIFDLSDEMQVYITFVMMRFVAFMDFIYLWTISLLIHQGIGLSPYLRLDVS